MISASTIETLVGKYYALAVTATPLAGYEEQNFLLRTASGEKYILKATNNPVPGFLQAQKEVLDVLQQSSQKAKFQQWLLNNEGQSVTKTDDGRYHIRLLTCLDGVFLADAVQKNVELYENLGRFLGAMDKTLCDFPKSALIRKSEWDVSNAADAVSKLKYIHDPEKRRVADYFLLQFQMEVQPLVSELRHAVIHGDANDQNILVDGDEVCGLIDFGDLVYSALINNVAIACAYAMLDAEEPLHVAELIVKGYHSEYLFTKQELDILYYLIAARLCISVTESARKAYHESTNQHHFLTEKAAWKLLFVLLKVSPLKAGERFRTACGFAATISQNDLKNLLEERQKYIGRNLSVSYDEPLKIERGALQYLYDDKGNTYLDCVNNVSHVGHCNPVVVRAMQKQLAVLNTNTRYLHDAIVEYGRVLTSKLPDNLKVCYFVNSGSEANDLAIRMARHFTGKQDVIVLDDAYHGTSTLAIDMSPYKFEGPGGGGKKPFVHKAASPNLYRGEFTYDDLSAGEKYAESVGSILKEEKVAAFICETLLGVGGQLPLPEGYLKKVYEQVRAYGGICIADEVQVGFARVGDAFWGFELQGVQPDIVVMGKPMGNGHPLAAVVVTEEIATAFNNGMEYFNTFGGNPVSMIAGLSVLQVIEQDELQAHAREVGEFLLTGFKRLMEKFKIIGDVRGRGLFIGVEMVKDRETKAPAVLEIMNIVEKLKERGFLLSTDGPLHNVLKIKPPLVMNKADASELLTAVEEVMAELG